MGRRLIVNVHAGNAWWGPAYGNAGQVPDEVAALIGDHAWDSPAPVAEEAPPADEEPSRAGRKSSRDAWAAHADKIGVTYPDGASRDDIIAAVDEAKARQ